MLFLKDSSCVMSGVVSPRSKTLTLKVMRMGMMMVMEEMKIHRYLRPLMEVE